MLIMLILFGGFLTWGGSPIVRGINMINIINISPVLATFSKKGN